MRRFAGLRLSGSLPDETTILNFRHLLETQGLGMGLFETHHVRDESISTPSKVLCAETSTNTFTPLTSSTSSTGVLDRDGAEAAAEKRKASVRAKVEHPFLYVKRRFGYGKVRYRGLKNQRIARVLESAHRWPLRDRRPMPEGGSRTHRSDFLGSDSPARQALHRSSNFFDGNRSGLGGSGRCATDTHAVLCAETSTNTFTPLTSSTSSTGVDHRGSGIPKFQ